DGERASVGADVDAARIPTGGNEAAEARDLRVPLVEVEYRDGVRATEGDVEATAVGRDGDGGRCHAGAVFLVRVDADRRHDGVRARVDDANVVGVAVDDVEQPATLVPGEPRGVQSDGDARDDATARRVDA